MSGAEQSFVQHHVRIAMRDGTVLSADIYRPRALERSATVLTRTCYTKGQHWQRARFWNANGYAYVVQDVRGRGDSEGQFYPLIHEQDDGFDTLEWIAAQSWSNGRVVMVGGSYAAWTQLYAACSHHSALVALAPMVSPADPDRGFPLSCGLILPAAAVWLATLDGHTNQDLSADDVERAFAKLPAVEFDTAIGRHLNPWREWLSHVVRDRYWAEQAYQAHLLESTQPMLHVTGWYDDCLNGTLENFAALSRRSFARNAPPQRLIVGPWLHGTIGQRKIGPTDFGEAAELDLERLQLRWFNACLANEALTSAPVQLFVMGRNAWMEEQDWPVRRAQYVRYYLHSRGCANSRTGDGALSMHLPQAEPPDRFDYDPTRPVPYGSTFDWKQVGGPDDCASLELREDVLVYTSDPLEKSLLVCGPLRVRLFAASSARDTDWTAKILDVYPDGRAIRLNDGAVRARFRQGHDRERFLVPGRIEEYDIDCWATCIELPKGHCLRLEISSSALGKYDLNLNSGGPVGHESQAVTAHQSVYHDPEHPSCVIVPVIL